MLNVIGGDKMKKETIITIDRKEIVKLLEEKYKVKFSMNKLSSSGFKGWVTE